MIKEQKGGQSLSILGVGTETYLYINGLIVTEDIFISKNITLLPTCKKLPIDKISRLINKDFDFAIAVLCSRSMFSQMRITAETPENLAALAWNAQWDILLLSAILKCDAMCNLQCTHPIEDISEFSAINITNYHMRGLASNAYTLTKEDKDWLERYYKNTKVLLENDSFATAIHSLASYKWHSMPRVQLAILWAGIEALFSVNSELSFRISLYVSKFLASNNDDLKNIFADTKKLYSVRSLAVHGSPIKGDLNSSVDKSASLLNALVKKCIEANAMPNTDELIFI
jgi:hypothetical protein